MYRLLKGLLIIAISFQIAGFNACRQSSLSELAPEEPVSIKFWHYYSEEKEDRLNQMVESFNTSVGDDKQISVEITGIGSIDVLSSTVLTLVGSGRQDELPNLFSTYPDMASELAAQSKLVDLNVFMSESDLEVFPESYLEDGRLGEDQQIYVLPLARASEVVALNLDIWEAFTEDCSRFQDPEKVFANWESISAAAQAYQRWSGGKALFGFDSLANFIIIGNRQLGIDLFESHQGSGRINLDRETMYQLWSIYYKNTVVGGFSAYSQFRSDDLAAGDLAAAAISTSAGHYLPETYISLDGDERMTSLRILPYPVFEQGEAVSVQQGAGLAVMKSDTDKEIASAVLLQWLTRPEQNISFAIESGYLPVTKPALESHLLQSKLEMKTVSNSDERYNMMCLTAFLEQLHTHRCYAPEPFPGSFSIRGMISSSLRHFSDQAREQYVSDLEAGYRPDDLFDIYINDAVFEKWYSQLVVDLERQLN